MSRLQAIALTILILFPAYTFAQGEEFVSCAKSKMQELADQISHLETKKRELEMSLERIRGEYLETERALEKAWEDFRQGGVDINRPLLPEERNRARGELELFGDERMELHADQLAEYDDEIKARNTLGSHPRLARIETLEELRAALAPLYGSGFFDRVVLEAIQQTGTSPFDESNTGISYRDFKGTVMRRVVFSSLARVLELIQPEGVEAEVLQRIKSYGKTEDIQAARNILSAMQSSSDSPYSLIQIAIEDTLLTRKKAIQDLANPRKLYIGLPGPKPVLQPPQEVVLPVQALLTGVDPLWFRMQHADFKKFSTLTLSLYLERYCNHLSLKTLNRLDTEGFLSDGDPRVSKVAKLKTLSRWRELYMIDKALRGTSKQRELALNAIDQSNIAFKYDPHTLLPSSASHGPYDVAHLFDIARNQDVQAVDPRTGQTLSFIRSRELLTHLVFDLSRDEFKVWLSSLRIISAWQVIPEAVGSREGCFNLLSAIVSRGEALGLSRAQMVEVGELTWQIVRNPNINLPHDGSDTQLIRLALSTGATKPF